MHIEALKAEHIARLLGVLPIQAGRRTGMRATLVSFLEQSPFATSDIIGHMTISFVIHAVLR